MSGMTVVPRNPFFMVHHSPKTMKWAEKQDRCVKNPVIFGTSLSHRMCGEDLKRFGIMPKAKSSVEIKNRRASFDYEFIETFQAGIVLTGTEIKSIRAGKASLVDAFCYFSGNELYVKNMHVAEYWWGSWGKHDPRRDRKLLLSRKELNKLQRAVKEKGLTIIGVKLYIADNGYAKLLIALARGKKEYDKRASIKEKDLRREMERM